MSISASPNVGVVVILWRTNLRRNEQERHWMEIAESPADGPAPSGGEHREAILCRADREIVFRHALEWFPALVPTGATSFDDLPILDKQRAMPWYGRLVQHARTFSSTGTSGHPKPIAWTPDEDAWYVGEKQSLFAAWLEGCSRAFISLAVGHNADSARTLLERLGMQVHDAGLSSLGDQTEVVTHLAPEVLYCSPSILTSLVAALDRQGLRPTSVRRVITNGEVLFPSACTRVQEFFGVGPADVMDTYGSTEIGTIAHSCPTCGDYHFLDGLYPEPVSADVVSPNGMAEGVVSDETNDVVLAVSSIKRTSFPVIRFVTYDLVRGLRRTFCQETPRFTFERIVGRCDDVLSYGELLSAFDLGELIGRHLPEARWYVFNPHNDLTIVIEGREPSGFREALRDCYPLHHRMSDLGLIAPPALHFVGDFDGFAGRAGLPAGRRGKLGRRVQRLVPEPGWFDEQLR
jgi:hypothetical protein